MTPNENKKMKKLGSKKLGNRLSKNIDTDSKIDTKNNEIVAICIALVDRSIPVSSWKPCSEK